MPECNTPSGILGLTKRGHVIIVFGDGDSLKMPADRVYRDAGFFIVNTEDREVYIKEGHVRTLSYEMGSSDA